MSLDAIRDDIMDTIEESTKLGNRPLIQVKLTSSGALVLQEDLTALRSWLSTGTVEIAENAEIRGTEAEQSDLRQIIGAIWRLKRQTPHGKFYAFRDQLEDIDKEIFDAIKDYFNQRYNLVATDTELIAEVQRRFPDRHWKDETIGRRLREIRAAGWLVCPAQGFYKLPREEEEQKKIVE